jgi:hypothetical protein
MEKSSIDTLLKTKDEIKDSFNKVVGIFCTHMANKYPESTFGMYRQTIHNYITDLSYEPIAQFIKYVYSNDEYRKKIIVGDETFFINQSYDDFSNQSTHIFMMKDIWGTMDENNKKFVKMTFKSLVERTKLYVDVLYDINKFKNS